jgi:hypothetical protein
MGISEILNEARVLSSQDRKELAKLLIDTLDVEAKPKAKTGAEIVALLEAMDAPIELVDSHIEDPVEWVKAQRRKRQEKLKPYWDGEA